MKEHFRVLILLGLVVLAFMVLATVKQASRFFPLIFVPSGYQTLFTPPSDEQPDPLITPGAPFSYQRLQEPSSLQTDPVLGKGAKKVYLWSSLACSSCRTLTAYAISLAEKNASWQLVWKDFISPLYPNANKVAVAGRCAGEQNKYWQFAKELLKTDGVIGDKTIDAASGAVGLNASDFKNCRAGLRTQMQVNDSFAEGQALGVDGAPYFYTPNGAIGSSTVQGQAKKLLDAVK